jgi:hypothetical protein
VGVIYSAIIAAIRSAPTLDGCIKSAEYKEADKSESPVPTNIVSTGTFIIPFAEHQEAIAAFQAATIAFQ